jgi:hypothetical protein
LAVPVDKATQIQDPVVNLPKVVAAVELVEPDSLLTQAVMVESAGFHLSLVSPFITLVVVVVDQTRPWDHQVKAGWAAAPRVEASTVRRSTELPIPEVAAVGPTEAILDTWLA